MAAEDIEEVLAEVPRYVLICSERGKEEVIDLGQMERRLQTIAEAFADAFVRRLK